MYEVIGRRTEVSVLIQDLDGDEAEVCAICRKLGAVGREAEFRRLACRVDGLLADDFSILFSYYLNRTRLERDAPSDVELALGLALRALRFAIDEKLYFIGVVVVGPHIDGFACLPIPMGEEVQDVFVRPLRLIHIINVLREARQVDDTKVGATRRPAVWRRLADIIEARPDILPADERIRLDQPPCPFVIVAPRHVAVIIRGAGEGRVFVGLVPPIGRDNHLVARHPIIAARHQPGDALRNDKGLAREILRHAFEPRIVIIKAYDIQRPRAEEMVIRRGFIAPRRNRARRVELLHHARQLRAEEGVHAQAILGELRSVVAEVQYQVRFGEAQGVCPRVAPLLQHFISDAPHKDGGVIAVAHDEIRQVALVPCIKIARVVVRRLAFPPHIEGFVHDDEAHPITEVQELGRGRIVRAADAVAPHLLQDFQLPLDGARIDRRPQASEVVVHTYAINLRRLAIERESLGGIEREGAEAKRRLVGIDDALASFQNRCLYRVEVRMLERPERRLLYVERLRLGERIARLYLEVGRDLGDLHPCPIDEARAEGQLLGLLAFVLDGRTHLEYSFLLLYLRRGVCPPLGDVYRLCLGQPDVAIDAAARVPARVGLLGVVHAHGQRILLAITKIGGHVVAERDVPVGAFAQTRAVDEDLGVHIDPVEVDEELPSLVFGIDLKRLAIPSDAARQGASARARGVILAKIALDGPVVREVQLAPRAIVEARLGGFGNFAQVERPILVEVYALAPFRPPRAGSQDACEKRQGEERDVLDISSHKSINYLMHLFNLVLFYSAVIKQQGIELLFYPAVIMRRGILLLFYPAVIMRRGILLLFYPAVIMRRGTLLLFYPAVIMQQDKNHVFYLKSIYLRGKNMVF